MVKLLRMDEHQAAIDFMELLKSALNAMNCKINAIYDD